MKNGWFCLTVLWETGEIQTVWAKSEKLILAIREELRSREDIKKLYASREKEVCREKR